VRGALGAPPFRTVAPKRAAQKPDGRTVGAKGAESCVLTREGAARPGFRSSLRAHQAPPEPQVAGCPRGP
jgi:hypothetical protein